MLLSIYIILNLVILSQTYIDYMTCTKKLRVFDINTIWIYTIFIIGWTYYCEKDAKKWTCIDKKKSIFDG